MKKQVGFILSSNKHSVLLIVPFHFVPYKYKKIQIKLRKYYIKNYRQEYFKGDLVLFDPRKNKIYIHYK